MVSALAGVPGMLDAVQRGLAGERRWRFAVGRGGLTAAAGQELARRIVAQGVVIVDVFIAQGDARDPLSQEGGKGVDRSDDGVAPVCEAGRHAFEQVYPAGTLAQQQDAGVGGDLAAVEGGEHHPSAEIRKAHSFLLADRCSRAASCGSTASLRQE